MCSAPGAYRGDEFLDVAGCIRKRHGPEHGIVFGGNAECVDTYCEIYARNYVYGVGEHSDCAAGIGYLPGRGRCCDNWGRLDKVEMDNCVAVYRRGVYPLGIGCQKGRICVYGHTVVVIGCVLRGKSDGGAFFKASVRSLAFKFHGVVLHYGECEIILRGNWINDDIADLFPVFLIAIVVAGCFVGHM